MKSYIFKTLLFGLALTGTVACSDDLNKADYDKPLVKADKIPTVTTGEIVVSGTASRATANYQYEDGTVVLKEGMIVSTSKDAPLADASNKFFDFSTVAQGDQVVALTNLEAGTTYYVKAYAYVEGQMVYGETKTITATDDYERQDVLDVDFENDENLSVGIFGDTKTGFKLEPAAIFGLSGYNLYTNTSFSHDFFTTYQASFASAEEISVLNYELDLSDKNFAQVTVYGLNLCALFDDGYPTCSGNFDVLVSPVPITTPEALEAAEKIGTCQFPTDPTDSKFVENKVTCDIPITYTDKCYIGIYNRSVAATSKGNMGVMVAGIVVSSLEKKPEQAEK